jgi:hypothetical protein
MNMRVRIKSAEQLCREYKVTCFETIRIGSWFSRKMWEYCGQELDVIHKGITFKGFTVYHADNWYWNAWMFETEAEIAQRLLNEYNDL